MGYRYAVLGAGRQGTAAAYDLAFHGEADEVVLADSTPARARAAVTRLRRLAGRKAAFKPASVDASSPESLARFLRGIDGVLSALPYTLHRSAASAAVKAHAHYCDLGCHLGSTRAVLALDARARAAGVSLIPDCGLAPGLGTALVAHGVASLEAPESAVVYVGGLPQRSLPPLGYKVVYALESMLALYTEPAIVLRRGRILERPPLSESEPVDFGPLGRLEARLTGGGTSTCPWSFRGRLTRFEYKTLRYPGHFEKMEALRDLGFLDDRPVALRGASIVPQELFLKLASERLALPGERDLVALRVVVEGRRGGRKARLTYELIDREDARTGFTAMERTTGFAAAAVLWSQVAGRAGTGARPLETALLPTPYLEAVRRRGLHVRETASR